MKIKLRHLWVQLNERSTMFNRSCRSLIVILGLFLVAVTGCKALFANEDVEEIMPVSDIAVDEIDIHLSDAGSLPVNVGFFLNIRKKGQSLNEADLLNLEQMAKQLISEAVNTTNAILSQCNLRLHIEVAQLMVMPNRLMQIDGNLRGDWGGHPPGSAEDPQLFNYQENRRLTSETRELFEYGKQFASANAISIFNIDEIVYHINQTRHAARGLSFPPNSYHHPEDYPARNSVLVAELDAWHDFSATTSRLHTPFWVVAHEIGHMLLNNSLHEDEANLMGSGMDLTQAQCERMRENRERLFGEDQVIDPGMPES